MRLLVGRSSPFQNATFWRGVLRRVGNREKSLSRGRTFNRNGLSRNHNGFRRILDLCRVDTVFGLAMENAYSMAIDHVPRFGYRSFHRLAVNDSNPPSRTR